MCGIAGAVWTDPQQALDEPSLQRMVAALRHRGPDDEGVYRHELQLRPPEGALPGVALGFRRLSIIDVAGGHQPISNEDGSVWMVFNGEIYNYLELRRRLEGAGHRFRTHSDSETIVHLYEDLGTECFAHLHGMFAVAIWDARLGRLLLARDRLGQKPLVYRAEPRRLLFASELKGLLQAPNVPRQIDPAAVDQYLTYQYVPHPRTIYQGVWKLPPGHLGVFEHGELRVRPYWMPDFRRRLTIGPDQAAAQLRQLLTASVSQRMRSDVPLGAFLSGGVDSSLIVALMQRESAEPVRTFSIGFPQRAYDETRYAELVARHLETDHQSFVVTPRMLDMLPQLTWHYDEPFSDSSAIPTWYVSQFTRRHVTVALSGDGGDELFAGYRRYGAAAWGARIDGCRPLREMLGWRLWQRLPGGHRQHSKLRLAKRFCQTLPLPPVRRYLDLVSIFNESRRAALYSDAFLQTLPEADPAEFLEAAWRRSAGRSDVTAASLADLVTYLPCDLNHKVDIASMAHSLEVRQPFLDHPLVEFAAQLPAHLKRRRGKGKWLLRKAFGELLPAAIWSRPKMGFGVPLEHWFRRELKPLLYDHLLDQTARSRQMFQMTAVERLIEEHQSGAFNHAYRLWSLLVLELWRRKWSD